MNTVSWCGQKETNLCDQKENNALEPAFVIVSWWKHSILQGATAEDKALRGRNLSADL